MFTATLQPLNKTWRLQYFGCYLNSETRLVLAGRTTHRHESHIDGPSTSCTSPLRSYN